MASRVNSAVKFTKRLWEVYRGGACIPVINLEGKSKAGAPICVTGPVKFEDGPPIISGSPVGKDGPCIISGWPVGITPAAVSLRRDGPRIISGWPVGITLAISPYLLRRGPLPSGFRALGSKPKVEPNSETNPDEPVSDGDPNVFKCTVEGCHFSCQSSDAMSYHFEHKHEKIFKKKIRCKRCNVHFERLSDLTKHKPNCVLANETEEQLRGRLYEERRAKETGKEPPTGGEGKLETKDQMNAPGATVAQAKQVENNKTGQAKKKKKGQNKTDGKKK